MRIQLLVKRHCVQLAELNGLCESFCFRGNYGADFFTLVSFSIYVNSIRFLMFALRGLRRVSMVCNECVLNVDDVDDVDLQ